MDLEFLDSCNTEELAVKATTPRKYACKQNILIVETHSLININTKTYQRFKQFILSTGYRRIETPPFRAYIEFAYKPPTFLHLKYVFPIETLFLQHTRITEPKFLHPEGMAGPLPESPFTCVHMRTRHLAGDMETGLFARIYWLHLQTKFEVRLRINTTHS